MEQDRTDEMDEALNDLDGSWSRLETGEPGVRLRQTRDWERESQPLAKQDPTILPEVSLPERMGRNWFLNEQIPRSDVDRGYVRVQTDAERVRGCGKTKPQGRPSFRSPSGSASLTQLTQADTSG